MPNWLRDHGTASSASTQGATMTPSTLPVTAFSDDDKHSHNEFTMSTPPLNSKTPLPPPVLQKSDPTPSYLTRGSKRLKLSRLCGLSSLWSASRRAQSSTPSSSIIASAHDSVQESHFEPFALQYDDTKQEVDEIVVDQPWCETYEPSISPVEKVTTHDSVYPTDSRRGPCPLFWDESSRLGRGWHWLRSRWVDFFSSRLEDTKQEVQYLEESWASQKRLAFWAAIFLIINWVLGCAFIPKPIVLADNIFYFLVGPLLSFPIIWMVLVDFPLKHSITYQIILCTSIWSWSFYQVLFSFLCGYYNVPQGSFSCGTRDFLSIFYYTSALQTVALFGLGLKRFPATLGAIIFFIISSGLILNFRISWVRNSVNFVVYEAALIYMHYQREYHERRLFSLRQQLKVQYKETQKAQSDQRREAESKHRLTSYVRVPLNTALLAVQNMEATGAISKRFEIEFNALESSLAMMSKVLNDVLDFNRMDSGKFESTFRPYALHQVMRSLFIPLQLAADARNLQFVTSLDPNIDVVARREMYRAMGMSSDDIARKLEEDPDAAGVIVGDETRLRQIVTNLASNACKFTPSGGRLTITTKLVIPPVSTGIGQHENGTIITEKRRHSVPSVHSSRLVDRIVVRIEVTDTGWGIRPKDMVEAKLFSAFNQTEQGRQQGGKGTGLGLALVRQIVKLSGGRLGIKSKVGEGSTFWVELPLGVGKKTLDTSFPSIPPSVGLGSPRVSRIFGSEDASFRDSVSVLAGAEGPPRRSLHFFMDQGGSLNLSLTRLNSSSLIRRPPELPLPPGEDAIPPSDEPVPDTLLPTPHSTHLPSDAIKVIHAAVSQNPETLVSLPPPSPRPANPDPPLAGLSVLVVDDDAVTRTLMRRLLVRLGCKVETAENGAIALERMLKDQHSSDSSEDAASATSHYDIVFMDSQMPVMSGLKAVGKLRELGRTDFIVGVTGNALLSDQNEFLKAGVDKVLTKPVLEKSLKEMLVLALDRRSPDPHPQQPP